jgi:pseudaminic acid cytidylyltransferase
MANIAIIPARGGSKRIPRKNIKAFLGKPMIAYAIECALKSELFDTVMVSTEDVEIAEIAKHYGAEVPFLRSTENADDYSGTGDVVFEVLEKYKQMGKDYDLACCIYATAPLISKQRLKEAMDLLLQGDFDSTFPVGKYSSPIWRSYKRTEFGNAVMNFPEHETSRSQDLPLAYFDAGQFYWFYSANMKSLKNKNKFGLNKGSIVLEDFEVQDIDNMEDWLMAELKYKLIYINK